MSCLFTLQVYVSQILASVPSTNNAFSPQDSCYNTAHSLSSEEVAETCLDDQK